MAMIRPETEMKDSGIEWVGVIPKEWSSIKGKYVYFVQAGYPFDSEHFSLIKGMPLIRIRDITSGKCETYFDGDYSDEYVVNNTDLLIGMDGDFNVRWWESGQAVLNQRCCRILEKNNISRKYLYYALPFSLKELNDLTYFTTVKHLSNNGILNLNFPFPPLSEQQAIADYLDETCSKIDEIIAGAKASIDEYKELKQAVIFEAVTKGLDKNVEMKQCSVNWLDEIPSTWESIRLKYLLTEINNRSETGTEQPLSVSQVMGVVPSYMIAVANPTASYVGQKIVEPNDIVFNKLKAHLGVFFMSKYHGLVSPDYAVYRTNDKVIPKYLEYLFHTSACISEFKKYISGVAEGLMRLYTSDLFNIRICLPKVDEQIQIVEYVENKVELFDSLIAEKESLIADLEAYKKSLIYEVVTGKRKVV